MSLVLRRNLFERNWLEACTGYKGEKKNKTCKTCKLKKHGRQLKFNSVDAFFSNLRYFSVQIGPWNIDPMRHNREAPRQASLKTSLCERTQSCADFGGSWTREQFFRGIWLHRILHIELFKDPSLTWRIWKVWEFNYGLQLCRFGALGVTALWCPLKNTDKTELAGKHTEQ